MQQRFFFVMNIFHDLLMFGIIWFFLKGFSHFWKLLKKTDIGYILVKILQHLVDFGFEFFSTQFKWQIKQANVSKSVNVFGQLWEEWVFHHFFHQMFHRPHFESRVLRWSGFCTIQIDFWLAFSNRHLINLLFSSHSISSFDSISSSPPLLQLHRRSIPWSLMSFVQMSSHWLSASFHGWMFTASCVCLLHSCFGLSLHCICIYSLKTAYYNFPTS